MLRTTAVAAAAMAAVVLASNVLVQHPVDLRVGSVDLADLLTWGAFTYPFAFLVTDLTNRRAGVIAARRAVYAGFLVAVVLSLVLSSPRIALASGAAFLTGQLLDVTLFDRLRRSMAWWKPPLIGSALGSLVDTAVFFTLAFAPVFAVLAAADPFALETARLLGVGPFDVPRWINWGLADLAVKLASALLLLVPYRIVMDTLVPLPPAVRPGA
jgi:hypothetical protein